MLLGIGIIIGVSWVLIKVFADTQNWNHDGWKDR